MSRHFCHLGTGLWTASAPTWASMSPCGMPADDALFLGRPFTADDVERAGLTRAALRRLIRHGLARPILHGVYLDTGVEVTTQVRAQALALAAPEGGVICDRTAAWLHGVDLMRERTPLVLPPLEVFRTEGGDGLRREGCVRGKRVLDDEVDVMRVHGVPVTTPLRTALDLGRLRRRADAFVALNALARFDGFDAERLQLELPRFRGMRGVVQLRQLTRLVCPIVESPGESMTLLQIIDAGLPVPHAQFEVVAGGVSYRLDFAYEELLVAVEYDGEEWHSSQEQVAHDSARRRRLRELGWTFVVLTKSDVFVPNPRTGALVRDALDRASGASRTAQLRSS